VAELTSFYWGGAKANTSQINIFTKR